MISPRLFCSCKVMGITQAWPSSLQIWAMSARPYRLICNAWKTPTFRLMCILSKANRCWVYSNYLLKRTTGCFAAYEKGLTSCQAFLIGASFKTWLCATLVFIRIIGVRACQFVFPDRLRIFFDIQVVIVLSHVPRQRTWADF